jgi:RNA polymerase sigma-70 factor (ECF subfamily)
MVTNESSVSTEKIWNDYQVPLKQFIAKRVSDRMLAEDLLHDTFARIHVRLHTLKDETKIESWVFQVARNVIADHWRESRDRHFIDIWSLPIEEPPLRREKKFNRCLKELMEKLPSRYRQAIEQVDMNGLSQLQLAEKLRISYSGAKSRVQRARQLLHGLMVACCEIESDKYGNIVTATPRGKCACA